MSPCTASPRFAPVSAPVQRRVEQHPERAERLAAPLGPKAEQDDVAVVELHVERRRFAVQVLLADQIARQQRRSRFLRSARAPCP